MAAWKTSPRIDEALGRRLIKLKKAGLQVRGLSSFLAVHDRCWRDQAREDGLPRMLKIITRFLREERQKTHKSLRFLVTKLREAGIDARELFASLGIASPTELAALDDMQLSSEVKRLCTSLARKPKLRAFIPLNLRFRAERVEDHFKSIARMEAAMAAAPQKARERVKQWNAALATFRVAAMRAGVKIRGL
jgi:hypothetical protein